MKRRWLSVALGDVCRIVSGATPKTMVAEYWDGDIPWATPKDLSELDGSKYISSTARSITDSGLRSCATTVLPAGTVLLSSRAPIGLVAINTVPMATNQGFKSLVPSDELDASYLYWWLRTHRWVLESRGRGATFKEISRAVTAEVQLPLPPLEEQKRIAGILDRSNELVALRRAALLQLLMLDRALFDQFLATLDAVPRKPLSEIVEKVTVGHVGPTSKHFSDDGVPFLRTGNVGDGTINWNDLRYVTREFHQSLRKSELRTGDVVLSRVVSDQVRAAEVPPELDGANCANVVIIRPGDRVTSGYLLGLIRHSTGQRSLLQRQVGSAQSVVNTSVIQSWEVPVPSRSALADLEAMQCRVREATERCRASLDGLEALAASLESSAFGAGL